MGDINEQIVRAALESIVALHMAGDHDAAMAGIRFLLVTLGPKFEACGVDPFEELDEVKF